MTGKKSCDDQTNHVSHFHFIFQVDQTCSRTTPRHLLRAPLHPCGKPSVRTPTTADQVMCANTQASQGCLCCRPLCARLGPTATHLTPGCKTSEATHYLCPEEDHSPLVPPSLGSVTLPKSTLWRQVGTQWEWQNQGTGQWGLGSWEGTC